MGAAKKVTPLYQKSADPAKSARELYKNYKETYGNNRLLDQAVRVVTKWSKSSKMVDQFEASRVIEIFDQSEAVEQAAKMIAREEKTTAAREKADQITLIRWHLLECLGVK